MVLQAYRIRHSGSFSDPTSSIQSGTCQVINHAWSRWRTNNLTPSNHQVTDIMTSTPCTVIELDVQLSRDSNVEPRLLNTLHTVPRLTQICLAGNILRELRSTCTEARLLCVGLITGLTIVCRRSIPAADHSLLLSFLRGCRLRRFSVALYLQDHGEIYISR